MRINDYPAIKIFILFLFGFFLAFIFPLEQKLVLLASIICLIVLLIIWKRKLSITNLLVSLLIIFVGYQRFSESFYRQDSESKILSALLNNKTTLYGEVKRIESIDENKIQFVIDADSLRFKNYTLPISELFLVDLNLTESSFSLNYFLRIIDIGNTIRISGILREPQGSQYFGEFDYKNYLRNKNINFLLNSTIFDELNLLKADNSILNYRRHLFKIRYQIGQLFDRNFEPLVAAYLKGLFIADRTDIPENVKTTFVNSGVIHVLAVSGLHTGYIALILIALFGRFNKWIRLILISIGLFVFVHLANLSPSVIRASVMSIIVLLNLSMQRKTFLLNSICIAGLIILFIEPLDILNPSFQLSFSAVISIALFYPALKGQIKNFEKGKLIKYLLDMFLITLSVSIGTFPFVASYYEKFSLISFAANLFIIPLTGIILGGIILNLFMINILPSLSLIYKIVLSELVKLNFEFVDFFGNLPFAYTTIKNFSILNSLIFLFLIFIYFMILKRGYHYVVKIFSIGIILFNYIFHFNLFSDRVFHVDKNYLILTKSPSLNSISLIGNTINYFSSYQKTDSLKLIIPELNRLNKMYEKMDIKKFDCATITSPSIFLENDLKSKFFQNNVIRIKDKRWFFLKNNTSPEKTKEVLQFGNNYKFYSISNSELLTVSNMDLIISPMKFDEFLNKIDRTLINLIFLNPSLDTLFFISKGRKLISNKPLDFKERRMLVFEILSSDVKEIEWWKN